MQDASRRQARRQGSAENRFATRSKLRSAGRRWWRSRSALGGADSMLQSALRSIDRAVEFVLFMIFLVFTLVGALQVFNRFVLGLPLTGARSSRSSATSGWCSWPSPSPTAAARISAWTCSARCCRAALQRAIELLHRGDVAWSWPSLSSGIHSRSWPSRTTRKAQASALRMDRVYVGLVIGGVYLALVAHAPARRLLRLIEADIPSRSVSTHDAASAVRLPAGC